MHTKTVVAASLLGLGLLVGTAQAQAPASPVVGATADTAVLVARAKIVEIDAKNRVLTVRGPAGNTFTLVAGPEVRNFAQIHKGDEIVARFRRSVAYVITKPGTPLPDVAVIDTAARAPAGHKPFGAVGEHVALTGTIVAIDTEAHTLGVINRQGGPVRILGVRDPERQAALKTLNVGDNITVVFTEAVAVSVEPAHHR
ncbi:MAG: hypothetical protein J0H57_09665, partial [Rhodospirillales bacterium]|nr:hypothetical protein [Rhodospirillales bacterium]